MMVLSHLQHDTPVIVTMPPLLVSLPPMMHCYSLLWMMDHYDDESSEQGTGDVELEAG